MMQKFFFLFLFALFFADAFSQSPLPEPFSNSHKANTTIDFNSLDTAILNHLIFVLTNKEREKRKIPPLAYSPELAQAAQYHTGQMIEQGFFSHNNPEDSLLRTPSQRIKHFGYSQDYTGENIIKTIPFDYNEKTKLKSDRKQGLYVYYKQSLFGKKPLKPLTYTQLAKKMIDQWMRSKGHRENILNPNFRYIGIGAVFFANPFESGKLSPVLATQNFGG